MTTFQVVQNGRLHDEESVAGIIQEKGLKSRDQECGCEESWSATSDN